MMHDIDATTNEYSCDALEVLKLKFISDPSEINSEEPLYPIEFAYQQFGDNEHILGYKDLSLTLCFTEASMFPHLIMKHKGVCESDEIQKDNVEELLKEKLVYDQRDCLTNRGLFEAAVEQQTTFQPPGKEIPTFMKHSDPDKGYALFRVDGELGEKEKCVLERIQSILYFFIERVQYTDSDDSKFIYYILYETYHKPGVTGRQYRLMAYCSLYKYYSYPDKWRLRSAHTFVFPQFRGAGTGSKLLHAINLDVKNMANVYDITLETPAPELVLARDYTSVLEVIALPEFTKANVMKPLTKDQKELLRKEWKMYNKQAARTLDILHYAVAQRQSKDAVHAFTEALTKRVRKPFEKKESDFRRMAQGLEASEMDAVTSNNADALDEDIIKKIVNGTLEDYQKTIDRLKKYSDEFQKWL